MYILGYNHSIHDSSACILKDGKLLAAAEEERFNRKNHTDEFPYNAIIFCLEEAGITVNDIDHIAFSWNPYIDVEKRIFHIIKNMPQSIRIFSKRGRNWGKEWFSLINSKKLLEKKFNIKNKETKTNFHFVEHHISHAASSFLVSPFKKAAIITIDSAGEWTTTMLAVGNRNKIIPIKKISYPHSIGILYSTVTQYLGFTPNNSEGTVMGLSSYGKPKYYKEFLDIVKIEDGGSFKLNLKYFNHHLGYETRYSRKFIDVFGPPRGRNEKITQRHANIASSLQEITNDIILHMANYLYNNTKIKNLCLAGGVALNCISNSFLMEKSKFKNIFIQPAANDAGTSIGAGFFVYNSILGKKRKFIMKDVYLGNDYDKKILKEELDKRKLNYKEHKNIGSVCSNLLNKGKIIGWFQGKMEFGPRALGNRSILADPRNIKMKDKLNKIKKRESFRPLAPSILEEFSDKFFNCKKSSPYMLFVYNTQNDKKNVILAATHIDGTARIQTVNKKTNPRFWNLINEFKKVTGIPVVLNTSFNKSGDPIIRTPEEAIKFFLKNKIDYLVLGDFLVRKTKS